MMRPYRGAHHDGHGLLRAQMRAGQIRAQDGVPVVRLHAHGQAVARDGGIIHQNVQLAEFFDGLAESGLHLLGVGHIHLHGQGFAAGCGNFGDDARQFFGVPRRRGHARAGLRQRQRRGAPDSLRRAGHQSDSIFQAEHGMLCSTGFSLCWFWIDSRQIQNQHRLKPVLLYASADSVCACASFSSVERRDFSSSTLNTWIDRSICRSSPVSTRPGPDLDKRVDALLDQLAHGFFPAHGQSDLADQRLPRLIATGGEFGVGIVHQRHAQRVERGRPQIGFEPLLPPAASASCERERKPEA